MALVGLEGRIVEVEADIGAGLPRTVLVGLPDSALYQARDRCKAAVSNSGQEWPISLLTINLSPATLPKAGSHYDLAIVAAILAAQGIFRAEELRRTVLRACFPTWGCTTPSKCRLCTHSLGSTWPTSSSPDRPTATHTIRHRWPASSAAASAWPDLAPSPAHTKACSFWTTPQKPIHPLWMRVHTVSRLSGETGVHERSTRLAWLRRPIGCSAAGPVVAASSDRVISAWSDPVRQHRHLRHSGRVSTHYGHLASIDAKIRPGATVVVSARY